MATVSSAAPERDDTPRLISALARMVAWTLVAVLFAFLVNVYLTFWVGWPGPAAALGSEAGGAAWLQVALYGAAVAGAALFVVASPSRGLRQDNLAITAIAAYIARFAFWTVLLVGLADAVVSFLRVEELLVPLVGEQLTQDLGRSQFRGVYLHLPLIAVSLALAALTRTLGFTWLAVLVVIAELQIVISRFVFSYEQAFMGDLVRFWYAGLFLFSSAYTLIEDGHVRVDVLYHGFSDRTRGMVNALGALLLGLPLCWVVLVIGLGHGSSVVTGPLLNFEVSQSGFGMYVKYLMAGMLGIFAITMAIQFSGSLLEGVADFYGAAGKRKHDSDAVAAA